MNFKKNFKRFFTLSRNAEGFTLVELIVVIAILGILAVVAVPTYGSYVERSQKAVDNSQIGVINSVFSVACVSNGVEPSSFPDNSVSLVWSESGKVVTGVTVPAVSRTTTTDSVESRIQSDFALYIGTGVEFKIYTSSDITFKDGGFVGPNGETGGEGGSDGEGESTKPTLDPAGTTKVTYNGVEITLSNKDINALGGSTFIEKIGAEDLMKQVADLTNTASQMGGQMDKILTSDGFNAAAMAALKVSTPAELGTEMNNLVQQYKIAHPGVSDEEALKQIKANAAVLYAAQQTTNMTVDSVRDLLKVTTEGDVTIDANATISANLASDTESGKGLSQAALAYGLYTSFANSGATGSEAAKNNVGKPGNVLQDLGNEDFIKYINSDQGKADIEGYLAAMSVVNSNTQQTEAVKKLMVNGFADKDLIDLIESTVK